MYYTWVWNKKLNVDVHPTKRLPNVSYSTRRYIMMMDSQIINAPLFVMIIIELSHYKCQGLQISF